MKRSVLVLAAMFMSSMASAQPVLPHFSAQVASCVSVQQGSAPTGLFYTAEVSRQILEGGSSVTVVIKTQGNKTVSTLKGSGRIREDGALFANVLQDGRPQRPGY